MKKEILESLTTLLPDEVYERMLEMSRGRESSVTAAANATCSLFYLAGMQRGLTEAFFAYREAEAHELKDIVFLSKLMEKLSEVMKEMDRVWKKLEDFWKEVRE